MLWISVGIQSIEEVVDAQQNKIGSCEIEVYGVHEIWPVEFLSEFSGLLLKQIESDETEQIKIKQAKKLNKKTNK